MIYGYKEMLDNRVATLAVAADTVAEFSAFVDAVKGQEENRNWNETYASNFLDGMRSDTFKGYKHSVLAVYHNDEDQRAAFWAEWPMLTEVQSMAARDRHADMLHEAKVAHKEATETEAEKAMTIEERTGLDKADPWDRRTEEEVEADRKQKEHIKEMQKKGEMSGDSFGGADAQRAGRDRPNANNVPGAYGRTQAQEAIREFEPDADVEELSNEDLAAKLTSMGVPDIKGVYNDGEVPQKAKESKGEIYIQDINGDRNEDGTLDISSITAHKVGGEVDEITKAERVAAHEENVAQQKQGRRAFSPEDFAAVLRGDGSADAITNVEGDDRQRRGEGKARPKLSDHAEAEIAKHQEEQRTKMKARRQQAEKEADVKARGERDRGIFKGADLVQDDDPTPWADLPEDLQKLLEENNLKQDELPVKNYPYNSELGGRAILPFDSLNPQGMRMVGGTNLTIEGTMSMSGPGAMVVSREDTAKDGYGIYIQRKPVRVASENKLTDMVSPAEEPAAPTLDVWLVRIRAA